MASNFPRSDYTPFGYLANPAHSAVANNSGIIRSVPPIGFGFWCRRLPWGYSNGLPVRGVNYLSFLLPTIHIDGTVFHDNSDFDRNGVSLVSHHHSGNLMSYDWEYGQIRTSIQYFMPDENGLYCRIEIENLGNVSSKVLVRMTNLYGYPELGWWGSEGITARYRPDFDVSVNKIYSYGDVFVMGANRASVDRFYTASEPEWQSWVRASRSASNNCDKTKLPGPLYSVLGYTFELEPGASDTMIVLLTRGVNERFALDRHAGFTEVAEEQRKRLLQEDESFYRGAPLLEGGWPKSWKHGWVYDMETARMTVRRPVGIFTRRWDAMQIFNPRLVLAETAMDAFLLSFVDMETAKEILSTAFSDAPSAQIPCSREDGSVNMIGADGAECGTAPSWGLPFLVILSIYERDRDDRWIEDLYPGMKAYLDWWLDNRTDKDGWFHCNNSWESGQDASRRFFVDHTNPGDPSVFVRTVDVQASMADAFRSMIRFAAVAGHDTDIKRWEKLAEWGIRSTQSMFVQGAFRDFDARSGQPIIMDDFYNAMLLVPLSVGIATNEQKEEIRHRILSFEEQMERIRSNPELNYWMPWFEWPPYVFAYIEAAWNAGLRELAGRIVRRIADLIYRRIDRRSAIYGDEWSEIDRGVVLPKQYDYRIPGVSNENWPLEDHEVGRWCEHYGWGAVLPAFIIRHVIGFRETADAVFRLAPALPPEWMAGGTRLGISNLSFNGLRVKVEYESSEVPSDSLTIRIIAGANDLPTPMLKAFDQEGRRLAESIRREGKAELVFQGRPDEIYDIRINEPS